MTHMLTLTTESLRPFISTSESYFRIDLYVKGVRCGHCVHKIETAINLNKEIKHYRFESGGQRLSLWSSEQSQLNKMMGAIQTMGFETVPLTEASEFKMRELEFKNSLKELAVAGVCSGNIMLFSIAIYLGADENFVQFFNKISFALLLPVLFYSARSIWMGFYKSIKHLKFNLDFPIGLALLTGFALSLYSLIMNLESIYFDSISMVVFLVLVSRFILGRFVNQIYQKNIVHFVPGVYQIRKIIKGKESWVALNNINKKDQVRVEKSEILPVDGLLLSDRAIVDQSILTGEAKPVVFKKGDIVFAGSRLCFGECLIEVTNNGEKTKVGQYISHALENIKLDEEESFRIVSRFTNFVLLSSLFTFIYTFLNLGLATAFERAFAIIIVACPCAVSFGIPLIRSFAGQLSIKNGIVIKKPQILTQLLKIKNICLDKTGTLTSSKVKIEKEDFYTLGKEDQSKLLALELSMEHPISNGFKDFYRADEPLPEVSHFLYTPSLGISGYIQNDFWQVKSHYEGGVKSDTKKLHVFKNDHHIVSIRVQSTLKNDLKDFLKYLSDKNKIVSVLSGDEKNQVLKIKELVPVKARGHFLYNVTPEDKERFVESIHGDCLMIGDGINDISAMKSSKLSLCMPGALENNMSVADMSLTHGDLSGVQKIFEISEKVKKTEVSLFLFSFTYNIFCICLAFLGYISPVVAAILMPISSLFVLSLIIFKLRKL